MEFIRATQKKDDAEQGRSLLSTETFAGGHDMRQRQWNLIRMCL